MRNLLVAFFAVCTIWSCNADEDNPTPAGKSTQNGTDTFTGMWVTNFFDQANAPDTFLNATFIVDRQNNDSALYTHLSNPVTTNASWWLSAVDNSNITADITYLHSADDSGWQEVYLFSVNDSAFYNCRSLNDTNKYGRFYGTN